MRPSEAEVRDRLAISRLVENAERAARLERAHVKRRGFAVPAHLAEDYRTLRKHFKAQEAGAMLGLINPRST